MSHLDALRIRIRRSSLRLGANQRALLGDAQIPDAAPQFVDPPGLESSRGKQETNGAIGQDESRVYIRCDWRDMHGISMDAIFESPPACMAALGNGLFAAEVGDGGCDGGGIAERTGNGAGLFGASRAAGRQFRQSLPG